MKPSQQYEQALLAEATKQKLTSAEVYELTYQEVAVLVGLTLGPKNESPPEFRYENLRRWVGHRLKRAEGVAAIEAKRKEYEDTLRAVAGSEGIHVGIDDSGQYVILGDL